VTVDPNAAPAASKVKLTLNGFDAQDRCVVTAPTKQTCIYVDFVQGSRVTTIATASGSNPTPTEVPIPPACSSAASTSCSDPGAATIRATSPSNQTATTGFTVLGPGTTTRPTTSSTSTTTSTSTSTTSTTTIPSSTTTESTVVLATTVPPKVDAKKSSSHSDVPRYIAVALVVMAAAATAAVDTRMRRIRG
jgi:hypothetical protein